MSKLMLSYFDNFPEFNGQKIEIRGKDGYVSIRDISKAIDKRFTDWTRTKFAKEVLEELSANTQIPITWDKIGGAHICAPPQTPLIDYDQSKGSSIFVHPSVAFAYSMSNAKFFAKITLWLTELMTIGTVNPHVLKWTKEEYQRGVDMNRDDIAEMYGKR